MESIMLWGLGYTGMKIYESLRAEKYKLHAFSAHKHMHDSHILNASDATAVPFITEYLHKNPVKYAIITFPPQEEQRAFFSMLADKVEYRLLLGTTSIYKNEGIIREDSPLDPLHERLPLEDFFIRTGGQVARLAGIYGPGRNPVDWYKRKTEKFQNKQLNLIHVDDIVQFIHLWIRQPVNFQVVNLSDGQKHTWADVGIYAGNKQTEPGISDKMEAQASRFVDNSQVVALYPELNFKKFTLVMENQLFGK